MFVKPQGVDKVILRIKKGLCASQARQGTVFASKGALGKAWPKKSAFFAMNAISWAG